MAQEKLDTHIRQEQIAQATLDLAARGGLSVLNVAAVARRVGVAPSALYRHFRDKDAMLDAALKLIHSKLMGSVEIARGETDDALEQLHRLLLRHVRLIQENRGIPQIIFSQDVYVDHPERRRRVYDNICGYLAEVARIIRRGQQAGQIARRIDADTAAVMFLGLIQPSAILRHMSDGAFDAARQARRAWPLYCKAIQDGAARSAGKQKRKQKGTR